MPRSLNIQYTVLICLLAAGVLFGITVFYPGMTSFDSVEQYVQAKTGHYNDHHPPALALVWAVFAPFTNSPLPMILIQFLLFAGSIGVFTASALPRWPVLGWLFMLIWLVPCLFGMNGVVWKDSAMAASFMMLSALCFRYTILGRVPGKAASAFMGAVLFYGFCLRYNGVLAALPLLFWIVALYRPVQQIRFIKDFPAVIGFAVFLAAANFALNTLVVKEHTYIAQEVYLQDLACMSLKHKEPFFPAYIAENSHFSMANLRQKKRPKSPQLTMSRTDTVFYTSDPQNIDTLRMYWINTIKHQPYLYFACRLEMFNGLLRIGYDEAYYPYENRKDPLKGDSWFSSLSNASFTGLLDYYKILRNSPLNMPFYIVVLDILLIMLAFQFLPATRPLTRPVLCLAGSSLLYLFGYFFVAISSDLRYVFWAIAAGILAFILTLLDLAAKKTT